MSNTDKGVLIYNEWFESIDDLEPKDYKKIVRSIYQAQIFDVPPPRFTGIAKHVAKVIFPCIERRKKQAEFGRAGAEASRNKRNETPPRSSSPQSYLTSQPVGYPQSSPQGVPQGYAESHPNGDADGYNIVKQSKAEYSKIERNTDADGYAADITQERDEKDPAGQDARAREENEIPFCGNEGRGFGRYRNVYLSTEEYIQLSRIIPDIAWYIDIFSHKLHNNGYRYHNHAKAILDWYERDRKLSSERLPPSRYDDRDPDKAQQYGSFDTDTFFEAAVKRSLGEDHDK